MCRVGVAGCVVRLCWRWTDGRTHSKSRNFRPGGIHSDRPQVVRGPSARSVLPLRMSSRRFNGAESARRSGRASALTRIVNDASVAIDALSLSLSLSLSLRRVFQRLLFIYIHVFRGQRCSRCRFQPHHCVVTRFVERVDSVRLPVLSAGTCRQCGSWSVAGHSHGSDSYLRRQTTDGAAVLQ